MDRPMLEVIVVSHGAPDLLRNCLRSLREHPAPVSWQITVVDSGSPDETPEMVAEEFPEVRLIRLGNVGFSAANNRVLAEAFLNGGSDMYLLLNPDTEVREGTLEAAIKRLESDPQIGMVGVRLITGDGTFDHASKRSFPTPLGALAHFTGAGRLPGAPERLSQYRAPALDENEAGEVDSINGAFMLVRREALLEVGPLDDGYWLYMEDLDWCRRFAEAGWKVFYDPAGTALHIKGGSSPARRRPRQEIAFHRGMGRFYRRFDAPANPALLNLLVYAGIGAKLALSLLITFASGSKSRQDRNR
jgi:GT2 family glycosyltransferase